MLSANTAFSQRSANFDNQYEPIRTELKNWDAVRGPWLSESIIAISNQTPIPDRNFPENFTPDQMLNMVPLTTLDRISAIAVSNQRDSVDRRFWSNVNNVVTRPGCEPVTGRSYGDPHLKSYDGARYSFQTVGEFILSKSSDGNMEVQARQKSSREDISLNTAVAMNVGGDRVGIYASDFPDGNSSTPVRVNGQAVHIDTRPYFLSNGGTIRRTNKTYIVDWPTGESVSAQVRGGSMPFLNLTVQVFPCSRGGYVGLMGNANGQQRDDFNIQNNGGNRVVTNGGIFGREESEYMKKQRLAWLAQDFADDNRINQVTSLFDYPIGTSTLSFTDRSFPRIHRTIEDMTPAKREAARNVCANNGIGAEDMEGCIFDNGYLDIPPSPRTPITNPSKGAILADVGGVGTPNVNDPRDVSDPKEVKTPKKGTIFDSDENPHPQPIIQDDKPIKTKTPTSDNEVETPAPIKVEPVKTTPTPKPRIIKPKPRPVTPRPKVKPRPVTPRPKVTPKPKITPKPGRSIGG
jgi:hypothetical protein